MPFKYSREEYTDMILMYGFCECNSRKSVREYARKYPNRRIPHHTLFTRIYRQLREKGNFEMKVDRTPRQSANEENTILELVTENPSTSTRRISKQMRVPKNRVHKTIKQARMHPYHQQIVQKLEQGDDIPRLIFSQWIIWHRRMITRILFTDESQFTRDGINNSRNFHIWAQNNPKSVIQKNSQVRFSINVWCGIYNNRLIGPHIFENRLTGEIYKNFLEHTLPGLLENIPMETLWLQHDGAPAHYSREVREYLSNTFENRWIGRGGHVAWPPRSPDLTPLDYFLWGALKQEVYAVQINSREQLLQRIIDACDIIKSQPNSIAKSVKQLYQRGQKCIEMEGYHFEQFLN